MIDVTNLFWEASVEDIKKGFVYDEKKEEYICLICGKSFEKGIIYLFEKNYYEAYKAIKAHIKTEHSSMFDYLINLDKKTTGITDTQKILLQMFHDGLSDNEIAQKSEDRSASTIRNHRFQLKQREKQAKIFLAIMELINQKKLEEKSEFINIPRRATMLDERFAITEEENQKILKKYFTEGLDGSISDFPTKEKRKIIILNHIINRFDINKKYTEKEVNEILKTVYNDYVLLRRYLIEYGYMDRYNDGSLYWVKI